MEEAERRRPGGVRRKLLDQRDIRVRDEEVGVGAVEDDYAHRVVGLELLPDPVELAHEREVEEVDRWVVDGDERHPAIDADVQAAVVVVCHRLGATTLAHIAATSNFLDSSGKAPYALLVRSRISSKGQITVPVAVREVLGLTPGTPV
ncbi:MAG: AbrB/MazE/SpoVT family DNA-binding domain-containing protein, partial [Deltaproteobacteria bacterium]